MILKFVGGPICSSQSQAQGRRLRHNGFDNGIQMNAFFWYLTKWLVFIYCSLLYRWIRTEMVSGYYNESIYNCEENMSFMSYQEV